MQTCLTSQVKMVKHPECRNFTIPLWRMTRNHKRKPMNEYGRLQNVQKKRTKLSSAPSLYTKYQFLRPNLSKIIRITHDGMQIRCLKQNWTLIMVIFRLTWKVLMLFFALFAVKLISIFYDLFSFLLKSFCIYDVQSALDR